MDRVHDVRCRDKYDFLPLRKPRLSAVPGTAAAAAFRALAALDFN